MASRRRGSAASVSRHTTELALATPQVMAHRLTRLALAGHPWSARDRKEFTLMGMEKVGAFAQAWQAMAWASAVSSQTLALQWWTACFAPWLGARSAGQFARQWQQAGLGVLGKGLAPIHAKATANARRLAVTPLVPARRAR
ncbi:polyhydroxyalkanoate granule-associated phasin [Pseudomonadota bacterium AL_CKDN230030165-1A_HGKHYDSX7]